MTYSNISNCLPYTTSIVSPNVSMHAEQTPQIAESLAERVHACYEAHLPDHPQAVAQCVQWSLSYPQSRPLEIDPGLHPILRRQGFQPLATTSCDLAAPCIATEEAVRFEEFISSPIDGFMEEVFSMRFSDEDNSLFSQSSSCNVGLALRTDPPTSLDPFCEFDIEQYFQSLDTTLVQATPSQIAQNHLTLAVPTASEGKVLQEHTPITPVLPLRKRIAAIKRPASPEDLRKKTAPPRRGVLKKPRGLDADDGFLILGNVLNGRPALSRHKIHKQTSMKPNNQFCQIIRCAIAFAENAQQKGSVSILKKFLPEGEVPQLDLQSIAGLAQRAISRNQTLAAIALAAYSENLIIVGSIAQQCASKKKSYINKAKLIVLIDFIVKRSLHDIYKVYKKYIQWIPDISNF